jgi:hypothetical protein
MSLVLFSTDRPSGSGVQFPILWSSYLGPTVGRLDSLTVSEETPEGEL